MEGELIRGSGEGRGDFPKFILQERERGGGGGGRLVRNIFTIAETGIKNL